MGLPFFFFNPPIGQKFQPKHSGNGGCIPLQVCQPGVVDETALDFNPDPPYRRHMNMNPLAQFSAQQLRQAADLMEQITALQDKLGQMIGEPKPAPVATAAKATKPTSKFSAAAKAALSAKLKAYWAKRKKGLQAASPAAASAVRSRPKMSAAGRARLVASAKARWARAKAAGQKTL